MTGGQSVVITDAFEREGLDVPLLTAASYEKLASFFNIIGGSYRNPLFAGRTIGMGFVRGNLQRLFDILEEDGNVDALAMEGRGHVHRAADAAEPGLMMDQQWTCWQRRRERSSKPFRRRAPGARRGCDDRATEESSWNAGSRLSRELRGGSEGVRPCQSVLAFPRRDQ